MLLHISIRMATTFFVMADSNSIWHSTPWILHTSIHLIQSSLRSYLTRQFVTSTPVSSTCTAIIYRTKSKPDRHRTWPGRPAITLGLTLSLSAQDQSSRRAILYKCSLEPQTTTLDARILEVSQLATHIVELGLSEIAVNTVPAQNQMGNPFDDSHTVRLTDSSSHTNWICPRCQQQYQRTAERLMNLERTGRYFFKCRMENCGTFLVVTRRKDSAIGPLARSPARLQSTNDCLQTQWMNSENRW